ncbi:MAG TPA: phosphoribosyltransferase [Thermoplasmata archaeon]|nr:phosphoribosyltransferase [Thermoplasmata archaeon]
MVSSSVVISCPNRAAWKRAPPASAPLGGSVRGFSRRLAGDGGALRPVLAHIAHGDAVRDGKGPHQHAGPRVSSRANQGLTRSGGLTTRRPMATSCAPSEPLADRHEAGRQLARRLTPYRGGTTVVLALPRGGVPVAAEIARALVAPLDILNVRKIGAPDNPEYALGAIAEGGVRRLDAVRARDAGYRPEDLQPVVALELAELERRARTYREGRERHPMSGRVVILVDDGVATGATMSVAIEAVRSQRPARVIVAVGVGPPETLERLRHEADEVVVLRTPADFFAVGEWYRQFEPVSDREVRRSLRPGAPTDVAARPRRSD